MIFFTAHRLVLNVVFDIAKTGAEKTIFAVHEIKPVFAIRARKAIEDIIAVIEVAAKSAFITQLAFIRSVAIHAIFISPAVLQMVAVFIVVASEYKIAIFVFERVVCVFAVFRLRKLECDPRHGKLQFFEIFEEGHNFIIQKSLG